MDKDVELNEEELKQKEQLQERRKGERRKQVNPIIQEVKKEEKKQEEDKEEKKKKKEAEKEEIDRALAKEKGIKIFGISLWRVFAYFIIYSVLGYIVETLFGLATKGVLESRKSFLYGPFCGIYGLGGAVMVIALQKFKKNNLTLFVGGYIVGSIIEFVVSLVGEFIFHIKWWDYSDMPFNINGRICFAYSLFWGVLAIFLMTYVNIKVDKFIDWIKTKISVKLFNTIVTVLILFMFFDCLFTAFGLKIFITRVVTNNGIEIQNGESYIESGKELQKIELVKILSDKVFTDEKMLTTFPNLKVTGKEGNIIYIDSLLKHIQPYYLKVFDPSKMHKEYEVVQDKVDNIENTIKSETDKIENAIVTESDKIQTEIVNLVGQ